MNECLRVSLVAPSSTSAWLRRCLLIAWGRSGRDTLSALLVGFDLFEEDVLRSLVPCVRVIRMFDMDD